MMKGVMGQTYQLHVHDIKGGVHVVDHASHAPQLMSCNYYLYVCMYVCMCVSKYVCSDTSSTYSSCYCTCICVQASSLVHVRARIEKSVVIINIDHVQTVGWLGNQHIICVYTRLLYDLIWCSAGLCLIEDMPMSKYPTNA